MSSCQENLITKAEWVKQAERQFEANILLWIVFIEL